jgi:hypothetical protein
MWRITTILLGVVAVGGFAGADDPVEQARRAEFLRSLIPSVPKPTATPRQQEQGFITYWADPTANNFTNVPPTGADLERQAVIRTTAGEEVPLMVGVWGLRSMNSSALWLTRPVFEMTVRVPLTDRGERPLLYGLGNLGVPQWLGPPGVQEIRQDLNTFFWINVRVPQGAAPGRYEGEVKLTVSETPADQGQYIRGASAQNEFGYRRVTMPFTLEVLPLHLPRADIAYGMYFRALESLTLPPDFLTMPMMRGYYEDMARHGHTSIYLNVYDRLHQDDGRLVMSGMPEETRKYWAERMQGAYAGLDIPTERKIEMMLDAGLIKPDLPIMVHYGWALSKDQTQRFASGVRREFRKRGWPEVLLYGPDEPDRVRADYFRETFERLSAFRGILRRVTAIAPEELESYAQEFDVWVVYNRGPEENSNMNERFREFQKMARQRKAEVWTYDCRTAARNPRHQRYYAGLFTWAHRLKGNFLWCYAEFATWEGDHRGNFPMVLPSQDGPVPSIAWEARREGITDYRILRQVERLSASHSGSVAEQARRWLEGLRSRVADAKVVEGPPVSGDWDKIDLMDSCPQLSRHEMSEIRNQALEFLLQLRK